MAWLSGRVAFLTVLSGLVAVHLTAVTFAAVPPNRYSNAVAPSTGYLGAYFAQNWRLFAPNPVAQDRVVQFQVSYRDDAGTLAQTEWIDWTDVELDLVRHRIVGGRAGYTTNKMTSSLGSRYRTLTDAQRRVADEAPEDPPPAWEDLASQLIESGTDPSRESVALSAYLRYERAVVRLGSDIAAARLPDREIVAIRYAIETQAVTPYAQRGGTKAEREAARPDPTQRASGWRAPLTGSAAERAVVGDFDSRHR
ncbi:DUF5819 family protein [Aeromicrobium sp. CF3.5]|uniref:DUF5819 family protein n=1 Tax=Aeromicrobium sp. CF3.5 TaxID=3373078 RepID=UPI003EE7C2B6